MAKKIKYADQNAKFIADLFEKRFLRDNGSYPELQMSTFNKFNDFLKQIKDPSNYKEYSENIYNNQHPSKNQLNESKSASVTPVDTIIDKNPLANIVSETIIDTISKQNQTPIDTLSKITPRDTVVSKDVAPNAISDVDLVAEMISNEILNSIQTPKADTTIHTQKSNPSTSNLTFGQAFAKARKEGLGVFEYKGKKYTTELKSENKIPTKFKDNRTQSMVSTGPIITPVKQSNQQDSIIINKKPKGI